MIASMTSMVSPDERYGAAVERHEPVPSFEAIVARYERPIYAFLRRMSGSPEDAADLTQETFLKAYRAIERTGDDLNVGAWLHRIAGNTCRDLLRRRKRIAWSSWDFAAYELPSTRRDDDPEALLLGAETQQRVRQVLLTLSPRQRQALILREYAGLSCAEIGAQLGVSEGAVKAILFRAREEFRKRYARQEARE